jgi:hypothetical protein
MRRVAPVELGKSVSLFCKSRNKGDGNEYAGWSFDLNYRAGLTVPIPNRPKADVPRHARATVAFHEKVENVGGKE